MYANGEEVLGKPRDGSVVLIKSYIKQAKHVFINIMESLMMMNGGQSFLFEDKITCSSNH